MAKLKKNYSYKKCWTESVSSLTDAYNMTHAIKSEDDYQTTGLYGTSQTPGAMQLIEMANLTGESRVLEIGCGIARIGRELAPKVKEWHGVDISSKMLAFAKERTLHLKNVFLHEIDNPQGLKKFPDEYFDLVYSTVVFEHLDKEDMFEYMKESYRILKDESFFYCDTRNLLNPLTYVMHWLPTQMNNIGDNKKRHRNQFSTIHEIKMHLSFLGFEIVKENNEFYIQILSKKKTKNRGNDGLPPFGYFDNVFRNAIVSDSVTLKGWALDNIKDVAIYLNKEKIGVAEYGEKRKDVVEYLRSFYPAEYLNVRCGFIYEWDTTKLNNGIYTLEIIATDNDNLSSTVMGQHRTITIKNIKRK